MSLRIIKIGVPVSKVRIRAKLESVCPITKTVDVYDLDLEYVPRDGVYVEFQSFKEFLESFRGREIFHEELAYMIAKALCSIGVESVRVRLRSVFMGLDIEIEKVIEKCSESA